MSATHLSHKEAGRKPPHHWWERPDDYSGAFANPTIRDDRDLDSAFRAFDAHLREPMPPDDVDPLPPEPDGEDAQEENGSALDALDATEEVRWFVASDGGPTGPFTVAQLRERWASDDLAPDCLVWRAGLARWYRLNLVRELVDALAPEPEAALAELAPAILDVPWPEDSLDSDAPGSAAAAVLGSFLAEARPGDEVTIVDEAMIVADTPVAVPPPPPRGTHRNAA
jgi:hypothetical protein